MSSARKRKDGYSHTSFAVRFVAMVLVVLFLLPLLSQVVEFAGAIDQDTIDQLKQQQTQTTETLNEYQSKLSALNDQKDSAVARYETLNQELEYLATQIENSQNLIASYQEEIETQTAAYDAAQQRVEELNEQYVQVIRAMDAEGATAYWAAILNSNSLIELVQTLNDLQAVTEAQQKVIHEMETAKQEASDAMTQITALMTEQEEAETLLLEQQEADEASVAELDQVIAEIRENEEAYADEIERLEAERNDLDLEIADAEAQLAAQQEAERLRKEEEERLRKAEEERKAQEAEAARLKAEEERKAQEAEAERKAQEEAEAARQKAEEEQKAQEAAQQPAQSEENTDTEEPKQEETKQEETKKEETKKENTSSSDVTGATVYAYASQFVGNPYVWGGTSLTNGCDCSGFVMQVYAHFGVSLPHSSASLRSVGRAVSVSDMQVGDIVCYSGHVGIYAGDGLLLSALGAKYGITYNSVHYKTILAVRRIF